MAGLLCEMVQLLRFGTGWEEAKKLLLPFHVVGRNSGLYLDFLRFSATTILPSRTRVYSLKERARGISSTAEYAANLRAHE